MKKIKINILFVLFLTFIFSSCNDDDVNYIPDKVQESTDPIDVYFRNNFLDSYGTAVRWRWDDKLVDISKRVTPVKREFCIPMGDFVKQFWIEPFLITTEGKEFMLEHFPPEIVFVGSPMYNSDGQTITLGYADAGARITFTQVNELDLSNKQWIIMQLHTAEHEYGHIVHQRHNLPNGFKEVTPANYKSNNWINMAGDVQADNPRVSREAISLGMVSNYGTSDENEDFCEILSIYLTTDKEVFEDRYLNHEPEDSYVVTNSEGEEITVLPNEDAVEVNKGRDFIAIKLKKIKEYYESNFHFDLDAVRDEIMKRINDQLNEEVE